MKRMLIIFMSCWATVALAAGGEDIHLEKAKIDLHDQASLQRGAKIFVNYCMGCHAAQFQRYERTANDLGIPSELFQEKLIFGNAKMGDLMTIAMTTKDAKTWFGVPPPDLTLTARFRGPDWLYTYLTSFYIDESRPFGVNNKVFKNVGMPHVLMDLQGVPRLVCKKSAEESTASDGQEADVRCDHIEVMENTGKLSKEEYDKTVLDLVNFLTYLGEPFRLESNRIGVYVILFLFVMLAFAYLLKREYWKDVR